MVAVIRVCEYNEAMNAKEWVTIKDAAERIGCSKRWIQMLIAAPSSPFTAQKFGNQFLVWLPDVKKYKRRKSTAARA